MTSAMPVPRRSLYNHFLNRSSPRCDFHKFTVIDSQLHGPITDQHDNQLPVGFLAQLVEHCTGTAEVMGSNPVEA